MSNSCKNTSSFIESSVIESSDKNRDNLIKQIIPLLQKSFTEVIAKSINKVPVICKECYKCEVKNGFCANINMIFKDVDVNVSLVFNKYFLEIMCRDFLFDDNPNVDTLIDMAKEMSNLTVGHAKVIGRQENIHFNISTPSYDNFCDNVAKSNAESINKRAGLYFKLLDNGFCNIFTN